MSTDEFRGPKAQEFVIRDYMKHEMEMKVAVDEKCNSVATVASENDKCCYEQEDCCRSPQRMWVKGRDSQVRDDNSGV